MTDLLRERGVHRIGYETVVIAAFVMFAIVNVKPIEVGAAVAGTLMLVSTHLLPPLALGRRGVRSLGIVAAGALLGVGLLAGPWRPYIFVTTLFILPLAVGVGYLAVRGKIDDRAPRLVATVLLVMIVAVIGVLWLPGATPPAVDMLNLHESAAEVMLDGRNPYTDAYSVDTNPFAPEGAEYNGYTYPPMTLISYAGSHILFGDSRWASVFAIAALVVLITRPWRQVGRDQAGALIALALLVVVQPWLGTIFWFGWTDPIALPLMLAGSLLWRRHPMLSAVLFGLAFGTRQYLILAIPVLLAFNDSYRWKRTLTAGGVAALTLLPGVVLDPIAFWEATVQKGFTAPIRLDTSGLAGIGLALPFWMVVAVSLGVAIWMARRGGDASRFLLALGGTCAVGFLIGFQAFMDYWFFVGTVGVFAVVTGISAVGAVDDAAEVPLQTIGSS